MSDRKTAVPGLPYVDRFNTIALTAGINVVCVLLSFGFRPAITEANFLINIFICGLLTTLLDTAFARAYLLRLRRAGGLPALVPSSHLVCLLPKNGIALAGLLGPLFGAASYGINWALIRFFAITTYTLWRIVIWQTLFACWLSSLVMQLVVLRMVQPDCALKDQPPQTGQLEILDPLPRFDALKRWFNTVTSDFGFNMVIGMLFGGVVLVEQKVVIYPTTVQGIGLSSMIFGAIVTLRLVLPVAQSVAALGEKGQLPPPERPPLLLWRLPRAPWALTLCLAPFMLLLSYLVLNGIFRLFAFQTLNFYQYFIVRTIFVALLTKAAIPLLVARYRQPAIGGQQQAAG